jgi:pimeloyl-ACP methyl ester carboxylesterase
LGLFGSRLETSLNHRRSGSGEPLVLIHGIGGELCIWELVLDRLAQSFDVIALDLPGFGNSPALAEDVEPTPRRLAAAVASFLDELGIERAHVAGNSLGGWVALEMAKARRTRSVTALCPAGLWGAPIIGACAPETRGRLHRFARMIRPLVPVLMLSGRARQLALGHVVAHPERVPYSAARRMVSSYARATAYDATQSAMLSNNLGDAESIDVPVTIAFGERDRLIRPTRARVAGARTVVLPDCGHIPMWDDPELVTSLIADTSRAAAAAA